MAGTLYVVATPIGNLEDITARALRILREVSLIAAEDTRRTAHLLAHFGIGTRMVSLREHNERRQAPVLVQRLEAGESIALVSDAGTPTISDPGSHLVQSAIERGIRIEPIPGPNAAIAALSAAGVSSDRFAFLGFPPIKSRERRAWFDDLRKSGPLVVFYEAPHRILRTLTDLMAAVGDIQVLIARELTKSHEELVRGPISSVLSGDLKERGEFTVVASVGPMTNIDDGDPCDPTRLEGISEAFVQMTEIDGFGRRAAISALARKYKLPAREVYRAVERHKISGG